MKQKILFISQQANLSGAPRVLLNLLRHLDAEKYELHIILNRDGAAAPEFARYGRIHLGLFAVKSLWSRLCQRGLGQAGLYEWAQRQHAKSLLRAIAPDLIYINTVGPNPYALEALDYPAKKIVHVHEMDFAVMYVCGFDWVDRLTRAADAVIACSAAVQCFLESNFPLTKPKLAVVYGSIEPAGLEQVASDHNLPPCAPGCIKIGVAGIPQFRKGTDLFVEIANLVVNHHGCKNVLFVWLGGDEATHRSPFMQNMRLLVQERGLEGCVYFLPETKSPAAFYHWLDIYLITSREDPFPLSMIEAAYCGKRLVGYSIGGVPELLEKIDAEVVDQVSAAAMAERLCQQFPLGPVANAEAQVQYVRENFSSEGQALKIASIINRLLSTSAR